MATKKRNNRSTKKASPSAESPMTNKFLSSSLKDIEDKQLMLEAERIQLIEKGIKSGKPLDMIRASEEMGKITNELNGDRRTYSFDPFSTVGNSGFKEAPTNITHEFLRGMARTPAIRGIIDTRQNHISNFANPSTDESKEGWTLRKKVGLFADDKSRELNDKDKRTIEGLVEFIMNCGLSDGDPYSHFTRQGFDSFLRETIRDSLTLDQLAFENLENRRGDLIGFVTVDAATIRYADSSQYWDGNGKIIEKYLKNNQHPMYVQLYNRRPVTTFYSWELALGIRNKHTDIRNNGYGISELEDLVRIVTWMLYGDSYNGKFFSQGAAPKGILKISGNVNQNRLNEFRMYWQQMVTGVQNAWRTPVIEADKMEWVDLQKTNQDMQFSQWSEYLIRIACAVFKIDSTEIGFIFQGGSSGGSGDAHTSYKQRTDYSKDKGLIPLLRFYEGLINKYIVSRLTDKYEFAWTGLSPEDEESSIKNDVQMISNWMTIDEIRAKRKLPPLPNGAGNIILNPTYIQGMQMSAMGSQQSNDAVDGMQENDGYDYGSEPNPFDIDGGTPESDNPFEKSAFNEINKWVAEGMPNTLQRL